VGKVRGWNPEDFAREQIQGLVRRVFFSNTGQRVKQVVFSAAEFSTDIGDVCDQVGRALALETSAEVAIVVRESSNETAKAQIPRRSGSGVKAVSTQLTTNVWSVPERALHELCPDRSNGRYWFWALAELRNEFKYAVIQGPAVGAWSESGFLGQLADGIILVLEPAAHGGRLPGRSRKCWKGCNLEFSGPFLAKGHFRFQRKFIGGCNRFNLTLNPVEKRIEMAMGLNGR
jgi:hypothetical protein